MRKIQAVLLLSVAIFTQQALADDALDMGTPNSSCEAVAKACSNAGFVRTGNAGKRFWLDCMKPILLGKKVANVTIDPTVVTTCRTQKVQELKTELQDFQKVK